MKFQLVSLYVCVYVCGWMGECDAVIACWCVCISVWVGVAERDLEVNFMQGNILKLNHSCM